MDWYQDCQLWASKDSYGIDLENRLSKPSLPAKLNSKKWAKKYAHT